METLLRDMGLRLVARRKQLGLTQDELAERADLTTQTVSTAETGRKGLRPENIIKLCNTLEISETYLFRGEIDATDVAPLFARMLQLSPKHYRCLENIVNNYIDAVSSDNEKEA